MIVLDGATRYLKFARGIGVQAPNQRRALISINNRQVQNKRQTPVAESSRHQRKSHITTTAGNNPTYPSTTVLGSRASPHPLAHLPARISTIPSVPERQSDSRASPSSEPADDGLDPALPRTGQPISSAGSQARSFLQLDGLADSGGASGRGAVGRAGCSAAVGRG